MFVKAYEYTNRKGIEEIERKLGVGQCKLSKEYFENDDLFYEYRLLGMYFDYLFSQSNKCNSFHHGCVMIEPTVEEKKKYQQKQIWGKYKNIWNKIFQNIFPNINEDSQEREMVNK